MKVSAALTVPSVSQPQPCGEPLLVPRPSFREKPEIPPLGCCWDAARPWRQFCSSALIPTVCPHCCRRDTQAFQGYPCRISQGFQRFGHADPSCLPSNPPFMAKRGALAAHTLRAAVAAAPPRGSRLARELHSPLWGFNKGFRGGEAFD